MTLRFQFGEIASVGPEEALMVGSRAVAVRAYHIEAVLIGLDHEAKASVAAAKNGTHPDSGKSHIEQVMGSIAESEMHFYNQQFLGAALGEGKTRVFIPVAVDEHCKTLSHHVLRARQLTLECVA